MRLHLGCGNICLEGYVNVDLDPNAKADIMDDIVSLERFHENSIELIYACNVLEHLGRWKYKLALKRWYELLIDGGILRLSVPNFEKVCEYYLKTKDLDTCQCALYAGQDNPYNYHYWCWDFNTLKRDLEEVGFSNVRLFDRAVLGVRDWSLNYMPYHDDKGNMLPDEEWFKGTFIALNVEATKWTW